MAASPRFAVSGKSPQVYFLSDKSRHGRSTHLASLAPTAFPDADTTEDSNKDHPFAPILLPLLLDDALLLTGKAPLRWEVRWELRWAVRNRMGDTGAFSDVEDVDDIDDDDDDGDSGSLSLLAHLHSCREVTRTPRARIPCVAICPASIQKSLHHTLDAFAALAIQDVSSACAAARAVARAASEVSSPRRSEARRRRRAASLDVACEREGGGTEERRRVEASVEMLVRVLYLELESVFETDKKQTHGHIHTHTPALSTIAYYRADTSIFPHLVEAHIQLLAKRGQRCEVATSGGVRVCVLPGSHAMKACGSIEAQALHTNGDVLACVGSDAQDGDAGRLIKPRFSEHLEHGWC